MLVCLTSGWARGCLPKNLVGSCFIIKGKVGRGRRPPPSSFLSRRHASIISSTSRLGRGVFLSLHGQARTVKIILGLCMMSTFPKIIVFYVCREHVLGVINLPSSLGRMWVSCHHCFIVLGHVSNFCRMVLLPGKPAWFCG